MSKVVQITIEGAETPPDPTNEERKRLIDLMNVAYAFEQWELYFYYKGRLEALK